MNKTETAKASTLQDIADMIDCEIACGGNHCELELIREGMQFVREGIPASNRAKQALADEITNEACKDFFQDDSNRVRAAHLIMHELGLLDKVEPNTVHLGGKGKTVHPFFPAPCVLV